VRKRLRLFDLPGGRVMACLPSEVRMIGPVSLPEKSGLKDDKGTELPPKQVYQPDKCAMIVENFQQPFILQMTVKEATKEVNDALKWAEQDRTTELTEALEACEGYCGPVDKIVRKTLEIKE
jgi:hypothetical protein